MNSTDNIIDIKNYINRNYGLAADEIEKVKNSYKVIAQGTGYCLKIIKYDFGHFKFILEAMKHLQKNNFQYIPKIIKTKDDKEYITINGKYCYLTKWIPSRVSNYDNPLELALVSEKLSQLHECSKGFNIEKDMNPRIGWFSWIKVFKTRRDEILDFKNRISQKAYKSQFDLLYLDNINKEISRAERSIRGLEDNNYIDIMEDQVFNRGFCHHDYAHHNILISDDNKFNVIDFDYCILDSYLHDVCSLLIRCMKEGHWEAKKADLVLNSYCKTKEILKREIPIMREFIRYPQTFWQIGIQAYWEQQPWPEEFFIGKLRRYLDDCEEREEFIDDYFKGGD